MNQDIRVINGQNWEVIKNHFQKQGLADEYDKVIKSLAKNRGQWTREQIDGFMQYLIQGGLTEEQAFEVEAALIDCYPGLTNIQCGHDSERGVITLDDLCAIYDIKEYTEPKEKYIIIKTSLLAISERGSLYEATRLAWRANLDNAKQYQYVLAVVNGIVREVYEVKEWFQFNPDRIGFTGNVANAQIASLKGQRIPSYYCQKGNANPFLYKKQLFNH